MVTLSGNWSTSGVSPSSSEPTSSSTAALRNTTTVPSTLPTMSASVGNWSTSSVSSSTLKPTPGSMADMNTTITDRLEVTDASTGISSTSGNSSLSTGLTPTSTAGNFTTKSSPIMAVNASSRSSSVSGVLSSSTKSTPSTTEYVYEVLPVNCPPINGTYFNVNTTDTYDGVVVRVSCRPPGRLVTLMNKDVYQCVAGHWKPVTPTCNIDNGNGSAPIAIIVGCSIGGFICLILVAIGLYMLYKSIKESREQKDRNKEFYDKMDQIGLYVNTSFQDSVGMPALTMDTRDPILRGRVIQPDTNPSQTAKESDPDSMKLGADLY